MDEISLGTRDFAGISSRGLVFAASLFRLGSLLSRMTTSPPRRISKVRTMAAMKTGSFMRFAAASSVVDWLLTVVTGTVGGGTKLPTQSEALDVIGLAGGGDPPGNNADAFAEIIATGALAVELSLLAALASRHLSSAHEELGR